MRGMKRLMSLLVAVLLVFCLIGIAAAAETGQTSWEFGGAAIAGQDGSAQGQNGWYFMWSPETNMAGKLDVTKIKECVASETGTAWFAYGGGLIAGNGTKGWVPDIYAADGYDPYASNNWWLQNIDGTMNPAVVNGDKATAILGFKAPATGEYKFDFAYEAGAANTGDGNDGLTISVNTKDGALYTKATSADKKDTVTTSVNASLKAGDMVYFAADPNKTGDNDVANFKIKAEATGIATEPAANPQTGDSGVAAEPTANPKTGDSGFGELIALMAVSACALAFLTIKKTAGRKQ